MLRERPIGDVDFLALVEESPDVNTVSTVDGMYLYVSPACQSLFGWEPVEVEGRPRTDFSHPHDSPAVPPDDGRQAGRSVTSTVRFLCRDGSYRWVESVSRCVRANGSTFVVAALHDITERRHANIDLRKQAGSDPLTGLANRRILMQRMQRAMGRPLRNGVLAVLYTDLDHFKVINDTFGHHIGDLVLVHMAERLTRCLRAADTLARLGGDEFVVMAEGVADERAAVQLASRINLAGRETFWVDGHELVCTLSVGVAWTADPKRTALALLNEADAALYRAKALGRDRAAVFDDGLPS